jgi:hypothetical protein
LVITTVKSSSHISVPRNGKLCNKFSLAENLLLGINTLDLLNNSEGEGVGDSVGLLDSVAVGLLDSVAVGLLDSVAVGLLDSVAVGLLDSVAVGLSVGNTVAIGSSSGGQ